MSSNLSNAAPFLRTSRNFPYDNAQALSVEVNRSYVDIANAVNARTIGGFALNVSTINGESWFFQGFNSRLQGVRQVYAFESDGAILHGLNFNSINQFTKCTGSFTDGTNWYGAIFGSNIGIVGNVSFYITPLEIIVLSGSGAPLIVSGTIVLEWLSQF